MAHKFGARWPEKKKIEVVTTYLLLGKAPLVEAVTGVSAAQIRQWKLQPWWKEMEAELRREEELELDVKLKKILDKSLETVMDRVENGDFNYDFKTGKMSRKPVTLKDVHKVSVDLIDKRLVLQGKPTRIVENQQTTQDHLKKLAEQFARFVTGEKEVKGITIENEPTEEIQDALHDGRKTGLQEGNELAEETRGSTKD